MWRLFKNSKKDKPKEIYAFMVREEMGFEGVIQYYYTTRNGIYVPNSFSKDRERSYKFFINLKNSKTDPMYARTLETFEG